VSCYELLSGIAVPTSFVEDLFIANFRGESITDVPVLATVIDQIVRDNLKLEVAISDLTPRVFVGQGDRAIGSEWNDSWKIAASWLRSTRRYHRRASP
jgi:hypothetical protein